MSNLRIVIITGLRFSNSFALLQEDNFVANPDNNRTYNDIIHDYNSMQPTYAHSAITITGPKLRFQLGRTDTGPKPRNLVVSVPGSKRSADTIPKH